MVAVGFVTPEPLALAEEFTQLSEAGVFSEYKARVISDHGPRKIPFASATRLSK